MDSNLRSSMLDHPLSDVYELPSPSRTTLNPLPLSHPFSRSAMGSLLFATFIVLVACSGGGDGGGGGTTPTAVNDSFTVTTSGVLVGDPKLVKDINPVDLSAFPTSGGKLVKINGTVYFAGLVFGQGTELWKSDGTMAGTVLVKDIVPGVHSSNPSLLTAVNNTLFFVANTPANGIELWKSDGTEAGTIMVKDIVSGPGSGFSFLLTDLLVNLNGTLFFTASQSATGRELWKSNGTEAGTVLVKDIRPGALSSGPELLIAAGNTLFLVANDGVNGPELWRSDGTEAGTALVKNVNPSGGIHINQVGVVGNTVYFNANDGTNGMEPWRSDGTAAGTVMLADVNPGQGSSEPASFTAVNTTLFFRASNGSSGLELWRSDGTAAGTVLVKDILPGSGSSGPTALTQVGDKLFFSAFGVTNQTLWVSDGTSPGTIELSPNNFALPGPANDGPYLTDLDGLAYFIGSEGITGTELWQSDGSVAGTVLVKDLHPSGSGSPQELVNADGTLFFTATPGAIGRELFSLRTNRSLLTNDTDPERDPLTAELVAGPTKGTLTLSSDGTFTYVPNPGFIGTDTFTYRATDAATVSNVATVTITVRP